MDSYDNDLMLLLLMDDDLFFVDISVEEQEQEDVEKVSEQPYRA
jgi:hypothetical protein